MRTLKDIHEDIAIYKENFDMLRSELWKEREEIIHAIWPKYDNTKHTVNDDGWAWDCPTSPFKYCVYDIKEDPAWDACLFCGEPEERK